MQRTILTMEQATLAVSLAGKPDYNNKGKQFRTIKWWYEEKAKIANKALSKAKIPFSLGSRSGQPNYQKALPIMIYVPLEFSTKGISTKGIPLKHVDKYIDDGGPYNEYHYDYEENEDDYTNRKQYTIQEHLLKIKETLRSIAFDLQQLADQI